jgi:hypothetical protein
MQLQYVVAPAFFTNPEPMVGLAWHAWRIGQQKKRMPGS